MSTVDKMLKSPIVTVSDADYTRLHALFQHETRHREDEIISRLVVASEFCDEETGGHVRRVGLFAATLAEATGWHADDIASLQTAASLHDIGKIAIPDSILLKPGVLTGEEFHEMQMHTSFGDKILGNTTNPTLQMAADIALSHHERWGGSGYPQGLSGDAIPVSARLVAVVDVYDSLLCERSYRAARTEEEALAIIASNHGLHFDPDILHCFLENLPKFRGIRDEIAIEMEMDL